VKILFVFPRFHTNQHPFVKVLQENGHQVVFQARYVGASEDHSLISPVLLSPSRLSCSIDSLFNKRGSHDFRTKFAFPSFQRYLRYIHGLNPDLMIVKNPGHLLALQAMVAGRILGKQLLFYTHGLVYPKPDLLKDSLRAALLTAFNAKWISPIEGEPSRYPRAHRSMHFLPFVAPIDERQKCDWFKGGCINVLAVGKFLPRKNHVMLLKVIHRLRRRYPIRLTIVGERSVPEHDIEFEKVVKAIEDLDLGNVVSLRTNLPYKEVQSEYLCHDVFVLASRNELGGVSVLEAMSKGLPVICSTTAGVRFYVEPGVSGQIFESDDADDLARSLEWVIRDRTKLVKMGRESRRRAEHVHSPTSVYRRFLEIVNGSAAQDTPRSQRRKSPCT
jgi:glycosyltransferase involved in cell wall biosynthesis